MQEFKTTLANDIEVADVKAQYDAEVKKILANKEILAWILIVSGKAGPHLRKLDRGPCAE